MQRVKEAIDREIQSFEEALLPEFKRIWTHRTPKKWILTVDQQNTTGQVTGHMTTHGADFFADSKKRVE
jgi:hypothetical protein